MKYAELWCKTNFSFLEGASHAEELATRAAELGLSALAITDRNSLAGVVRAHQAAKSANLKLLIGAEITPIDSSSSPLSSGGEGTGVRGLKHPKQGPIDKRHGTTSLHKQPLTPGPSPRSTGERGEIIEGEPIILLAMNIAGYRNLSQLITRGRRAAVKGECRLTVDDIADYAEDLLAVIPSCRSPLANAVIDASGHPRRAAKQEYREIFGDRAYLAAAVHLGPCDDAELERAVQHARQHQLPFVATNQVFYHAPSRRPLHDVLTAVRNHTTVANLGALRFSNGERHLKSAEQMAQLFARYPDAIRRTMEVADRCTFSLDELRYEYPEELCPAGHTATTFLAERTWAGARERYPDGVPDKIRDLLDKELALIAELRYEAFFLTVWDLVVFARSRGILCQGRGSAANSAVCYCLGITSVDPDRTDLLFERFISKERNEAPDIDVDFEHERREEVFQYIYQKYGRERAGIVAEVITYQPRSAVRDVGKALGLSLDAVDRLAKAIDWHAEPEVIGQRIEEAGLAPSAMSVKHLVELTGELLSFPRHLSQHVGGFVITGRPLSEIVPIENAAMPDRTVIEWDKDDIDALGILKVDCLSLGMLTAIRKCFDLIGPVFLPSPPAVDTQGECKKEIGGGRGAGGEGGMPPTNATASPLTPDPSPPGHPVIDATSPCRPGGEGRTASPRLAKLTLATIPPENPVVYDMICAADTIGVFQIESRAQMSMLPRLKPRKFYDLVIEVAIVRPGPIQGGMVHPYLRRRSGLEKVTYPHPVVEEVLSKTLGVPLFQEQVMRLAIVAAGFTPGEADQLRRAMGAWKRRGTIEKFRAKFHDGLMARGFPPEFADQIYAQIAGFGEYGFPESHAASFALLAYVSAWLKCHYPAEFTAALLNSQPMGFYGAAQLIQDARAHGVEVLPVDVNLSEWDCTLEEFPPSPLRGRGAGGEGAVPQEEWKCIGDEKRNEPELSALTNDKQEHDAIASAAPSPPAPLPRWGEGRKKAIRLGFRLIRGFPEAHATALLEARRAAPFRSIADVHRRGRVSKAQLARLAAADAFGSLGLDRRAALWKVLALGEELPLFAELDDEVQAPRLPELSIGQHVIADYQTIGLSLKAHPIELIRPDLDRMNVVTAKGLDHSTDKTSVRVAGLVTIRQRPPTANGTVFMSLEDETGFINLVIWNRTWERFRKVAKDAVALYVEGKVEKVDGVTHVFPSKIEDLSSALAGLDSRSRDFR